MRRGRPRKFTLLVETELIEKNAENPRNAFQRQKGKKKK